MLKKILFFMLALCFPLLGVPLGRLLSSAVPAASIPYCYVGAVLLLITLPAAAGHHYLTTRHPAMGLNLGLTEGLGGGSLIWMVVASLFNFHRTDLGNWGLLLLGLAALVAWILYRRAKQMQSRRTQVTGMVLGLLASPLYLALYLFVAFHRPLMPG